MQSCDEILTLLSAGVDGALSDTEQATLDRHLIQCPACSALFDDLLSIHETGFEELAAPAGFAAGVMAAISENPAQEKAAEVFPFPNRKRRFPWKALSTCAAAVAVVVLCAVSLPSMFTMGGSKGGNSAPDLFPGVENESVMDNMEDSSLSQSGVSDDADSQGSAVLVYDSTVHCGMAVLNGTVLPEGLEEYECYERFDGCTVWPVPSDWFFTLNEQGFFEDTKAVTRFELSGTEGEYGLIVLDKEGVLE